MLETQIFSQLTLFCSHGEALAFWQHVEAWAKVFICAWTLSCSVTQKSRAEGFCGDPVLPTHAAAAAVSCSAFKSIINQRFLISTKAFPSFFFSVCHLLPYWAKEKQWDECHTCQRCQIRAWCCWNCCSTTMGWKEHLCPLLGQLQPHLTSATI